MKRVNILETFRKHGKWLFIPAPIILLVAAKFEIGTLLWVGIGLLLILLVILTIERLLKKELIS